MQEAYRLNLPATAFPGKTKDGHFSLCGTQDSNVVLETVKRAEDGDGWIVRVYESDNARTKTALYWGRSVLSVTECNALEEPVSEMTWEADEESGTFVVPFVIKPYEIKTFRIREA